jgi:hypothetical protein
MERYRRYLAATATDTVPGSYYGPDRMFGLKGDPVLIPIPKPARDETAARRLWEISEKLTGVAWSAEEQKYGRRVNTETCPQTIPGATN